MQINFKKLKEIETQYENSPISLNALQSTVNIILHVDDPGSKFATNYNIAVNTLIELGILEYNKQNNNGKPTDS